MAYIFIGLIIFVVFLTLFKMIRGKKVSGGDSYTPLDDAYSGRIDSTQEKRPSAETTRRVSYEDYDEE
ncbi:hypothetical protein FH966_01500 [Lentibacillus cibarius]|uniref:DUF3951 domain-containing protein n=1 Tax=Lentibacillus cibarius TaxID=2583219 RepID=A0A549YF30_9BACI|nr:hypothetical protein [Lentibacillus cibarius]TRM10500.1 hypothetical protein FH966_01500 [Lentibacillus cibarius]